VTAKVASVPVSWGNSRPTFLLHYEIQVRKFFIVPACSSPQGNRSFHADHEGAGTELWKTTPGLQHIWWVCSARGTPCTRIAAGIFCRCRCHRRLGRYFGNEGSGAAGAQLLAVTSAKQATPAISSSVLDSSPICFRALGPSGRTCMTKEMQQIFGKGRRKGKEELSFLSFILSVFKLFLQCLITPVSKTAH